MLQRLPIALAQLKVYNTSENLLNEIHQIIYSLYQAKEITKKLWNTIMNLIKLSGRMYNIFTNLENNKTSDLHRLLLHLSQKKELINKCKKES